MAQVNFRIDDETKRRAEKLFSSMGLTMSGAITIFIQQTLNRNEIPFPVQGTKPPNLTKEELLRRIDDMEHGRNCHYHDLIEVDYDNDEQKPKSRRTTTRRRRTVA